MLKVLRTLRNTLAHARSHTPDPGIHMGNGSATEVAASRGGARRDASFLTSRQPAWDGQGEGIGPRAPRWSPDATSRATQAPWARTAAQRMWLTSRQPPGTSRLLSPWLPTDAARPVAPPSPSKRWHSCPSVWRPGRRRALGNCKKLRGGGAAAPGKPWFPRPRPRRLRGSSTQAASQARRGGLSNAPSTWGASPPPGEPRDPLGPLQGALLCQPAAPARRPQNRSAGGGRRAATWGMSASAVVRLPRGHACARTHTHTGTDADRHTDTDNTHSHTDTHAHTHIYTQTHTNTHADTDTHTIDTQTQIHTLTHSQTQTH